MKSSISLLFLLPAVACAQTTIPTPTPSPLDIDNITAILQSSLKIAGSLPGVLGAIFVAVIGLTLAVLLIAKYFVNKGAQETAAYQAQLQTQLTQNSNLAKMQVDAAQALINNMNTLYQQDYDYFVQMLGANNYVAIYAKLDVQFHTKIAGFIYDATIPATQKAASIIHLMQAVSGSVQTGTTGVFTPAK